LGELLEKVTLLIKASASAQVEHYVIKLRSGQTDKASINSGLAAL